MSVDPWLGRDDHGGVPSQARPDRIPPRHWRLDAVYATGRPHHQVVSPDGSTVAYSTTSSGLLAPGQDGYTGGDVFVYNVNCSRAEIISKTWKGQPAADFAPPG